MVQKWLIGLGWASLEPIQNTIAKLNSKKRAMEIMNAVAVADPGGFLRFLETSQVQTCQ